MSGGTGFRPRHVAVSLHGVRANESPEQCLYAMVNKLAAYFDDSGKPADSPVVIFCGFVAPLDQWLAFERDWTAILRRPEFDVPHFHMREVRRGRGQFAKFLNNEPLVASLLERLQRLIRARVVETFGACVITNDYNTVNADYMLDERFGPPGVMAAGVSLTKLMSWNEKRQQPGSLTVVVDQGIDHWGLIDSGFYERYGFRLVPGEVSKVPGLQAGDFVAWELRRAMAAVATGQVAYWDQLRRQFMKFLAMFSPDQGESVNWWLLDEEELRRTFAGGDEGAAPRHAAARTSTTSS